MRDFVSELHSDEENEDIAGSQDSTEPLDDVDGVQRRRPRTEKLKDDQGKLRTVFADCYVCGVSLEHKGLASSYCDKCRPSSIEWMAQAHLDVLLMGDDSETDADDGGEGDGNGDE